MRLSGESTMQIDNELMTAALLHVGYVMGNGNGRATSLAPYAFISYMPAAQGQRMRRPRSVLHRFSPFVGVVPSHRHHRRHRRSNTESSFGNWIPSSAHFPTVLSVCGCFVVQSYWHWFLCAGQRKHGYIMGQINIFPIATPRLVII